MNCPLCQSTNHLLLPESWSRQFFLCNECQLVFVNPHHLLSADEEKQRYEKHQNSTENEGYVNFLNLLVNPLSQFIKPPMIGLDYGCGPHPTLALLLAKRGISCENYDPYFFKAMNSKKYDFITATESFEHFNNTGKEIQNILNILKPGGFLAVMTELWESITKLKDWYYMRDLTHVCFYHYKTFEYIANKQNLELVHTDYKRVLIFKVK